MESIFAVIFSNNIPVLKYYSLRKLLFKCPLTISKCPMTFLERCSSYKELSYSKMTEKRQGPTQGVRLMDVSVKRELTVFLFVQRDVFVLFLRKVL